MSDTSSSYPVSGAPAPLTPAPAWQGLPTPAPAPLPLVPAQDPAPAPAPLAPAPAPVTPPPAPVHVPSPTQQVIAAAFPQAAPEPSPRKERASRASALAAQRTVIRRTANKMQELTEADPADLNLVRCILGAGENIADLTVAILTASKSDTQVISDALAILEADPFEAGVVAATLDTRLRAAWRFYAELGVVGTEMPASEVKAAIALARAVHESDADLIRLRVEQALTLMKK